MSINNNKRHLQASIRQMAKILRCCGFCTRNNNTPDKSHNKERRDNTNHYTHTTTRTSTQTTHPTTHTTHTRAQPITSNTETTHTLPKYTYTHTYYYLHTTTYTKLSGERKEDYCISSHNTHYTLFSLFLLVSRGFPHSFLRLSLRRRDVAEHEYRSAAHRSTDPFLHML